MFSSVLQRILSAHKSKTFQTIWEDKCKEVLRKKKAENEMLKGELTLDDVLNKVWPSSIEKWTHLSQTVYDGSIHLKDVERNFRQIDSEKDLKEELNGMFGETVGGAVDDIASRRVDQIARYRSLQMHIGAAETVWKFKEALGLSGDFTVVEEIRNQVYKLQQLLISQQFFNILKLRIVCFQASEEFKDKDLKSIDERYAKAGSDLTAISLQNSRCLDAVIECKPLVKWLRETIKGDVKYIV